MRALRVHRLIGPRGMSLDDIAEPSTRDRDRVRVAVRAAGVGFIDTLSSRGRFDRVPRLPFIPGREVAGVVTEAGDGSGYVVGDHVIGYVPHGGFAETVWVRPETLAPLPPELSFAEGAAMVVNYHTAFVALWRRAQLRPGESVLVHGAGGGIGSAAVQVAVALGARVVAVAGTRERRAVAEAAGADHVCGSDEWHDAVGAAGGVDVIVDPVGGSVFERSLDCLAPEGRIVSVGCASDTAPRFLPEHLTRHSGGVLGLSWSDLVGRDSSLFTRTAKQLDELIAQGLRPLVTRTFAFTDGIDALRTLESRTGAGKLILAVS